MEEKLRSTLQFDIDFDKFRKEYQLRLFWLDEVLKLHAFFEAHGFAYVFQTGYQANRVLSPGERDELFQHMTQAFPWIVECTTRFDYLELGEPRDVTPRPKTAIQAPE